MSWQCPRILPPAWRRERSEEQALWDAYNLLCRGPDIERLRKLLVRYDLFRNQSGSGKRVVGFDMFSEFPEPSDAAEKNIVAKLVEEAPTRLPPMRLM